MGAKHGQLQKKIGKGLKHLKLCGFGGEWKISDRNIIELRMMKF